MFILVVGSANRDMIVPVHALPRPGETVSGRDPVWHFGGKGANQAVAAARCGAPVKFIAALGADGAGAEYRTRLQSEGIDMSDVIQVPETATGTAVIFVDDAAQNMIVVSSGANALCTPSRLPNLERALAECAIVIMQLEIPLETVEHVIRLANRHGKPVILNPSPLHAAVDLKDNVIDYLIVNDVELETLSGARSENEDVIASSAARLCGSNIRNVIVTRGSESTFLVTPDGVTPINTHPVTPVDTVGAGDTFAGAFAAALDEGRSASDAIRFANTAAALSTLKLGAQESMPTRQQVEAQVGH